MPDDPQTLTRMTMTALTTRAISAATLAKASQMAAELTQHVEEGTPWDTLAPLVTQARAVLQDVDRRCAAPVRAAWHLHRQLVAWRHEVVGALQAALTAAEARAPRVPIRQWTPRLAGTTEVDFQTPTEVPEMSLAQREAFTQLVHAVARGEAPLSLLSPNWRAIRVLTARQGMALAIPGLEVVPRQRVVRTRREDPCVSD